MIESKPQRSSYLTMLVMFLVLIISIYGPPNPNQGIYLSIYISIYLPMLVMFLVLIISFYRPPNPYLSDNLFEICIYISIYIYLFTNLLTIYLFR